MEENEALIQKIRNLYNDEKSHKFIVHLIYSFIPIQTKASKIFDDKSHSCCITKQKLLTVDETMSIIHSLNMDNVIKGMFDVDANKRMREELSQKQNGRYMGYTAEDTDKCLSLEALQSLQYFVEMELLNGNGEINSILTKIRRKQGIMF